MLESIRSRVGGRPWLALLALVVLLPARVALAHAHYDHSSPSIGQVLQTAPSRVDIYTDSEVRKLAGSNQISVTGPDGSRVDDGNTVVDDADRRHFSTGLMPNLGQGRYVVSFQTLSDADGDTDRGRFPFYVGAGPTAQDKALDATLTSASAGVAVAEKGGNHTLPFLAIATGVLVLLAGALLALVLVWRRRGANP